MEESSTSWLEATISVTGCILDEGEDAAGFTPRLLTSAWRAVPCSPPSEVVPSRHVEVFEVSNPRAFLDKPSVSFVAERPPVTDHSLRSLCCLPGNCTMYIEDGKLELYICDDTDGREAVRNRLFVRWFEEYDINNRFTIKTADAIVEGKGFYTAIIVENNHPKLHDITQEFDEVASTLTAK